MQLRADWVINRMLSSGRRIFPKFIQLLSLLTFLLPGIVEGQGLNFVSSTVNLTLGGSTTLSAEALGLADSGVTWSVITGGGTVDAVSGVYTAPATLPAGGRAVIRAVANADSTRTGCVTIWLSPALSLAAVGEPVEVPGSSGSIIAADMNGDGRPDLVRKTSLLDGASVLGGLNVMLNTVSGWQSSSNIIDDRLFQFVAGDIDSDGDTDILVILRTFQNGNRSALQVYLNDGTGNLTAQAASSFIAGLLTNPVLADFNGDGRTDLAVSQTNADPSTNIVGVIYNDGANFFDPGFKLISVLDHAAGGGLDAGDFNGDGRPDLVAGDSNSSKLSIVINAGGGAWEVPTTYEVGYAPNPTVGDFTGDGWADVVMTSADGSLYLLTNSADHTGTVTASAALLTLPTGVRQLKAVHLNTDAQLDLVALAGNNAALMLPGAAGGGFDPPSWLFYGAVFGADTADFDGDGRLDIVGTGLNTNTTHIFPGAESGSYAFGVHPTSRFMNLGRSAQFSYLALNPSTPPPASYQVSWSAGADMTGTVTYQAPALMPSDPAVAVTVTRSDTGETAAATVTLTAVGFSSALPAGRSVWSIFSDPEDPATLYVGCEGGLVFRSNGGTDAVQLGASFTINPISRLALALDASGATVLLAADGVGLFRYDPDAGTEGNWQETGAPGLTVAFAATSDSAAVYAVQADGTFHRSDDGAATWNAVSLPPWMGSAKAVWAVSATRLYVSYLADGIYRLAGSHDGGINWTDCSAGLGRHSQRIVDLVWDHADPNCVMLTFSKGNMYYGDLVFRSTDGGALWQPVTDLPLNRSGRALAAAPTAPGTVYAMGDNSYEQYVIYKSLDWGQTWWDITNGLPTGYRYTIAASALGSEFLYAGTAGGLFATKFPPLYGALKVTLQPEGALAVGAQWRQDDGDWQENGAILDLAPGDYNISFSAITGWITPGIQTVTVTAGDTANVTGIYNISTYTVTFDLGDHGTHTDGGDLIQTVQHGASTVDPEFSVADGWLFAGWVPALPTIITADFDTTASYLPQTFTITASAGAGGSISPAGSMTVLYGQTQSFTVTADPYWHISDILIDGVSAGADASSTFENVTSAHTIKAQFVLDAFIYETSWLWTMNVNGAEPESLSFGLHPGATDQIDAGVDIQFAPNPDAWAGFDHNRLQTDLYLSDIRSAPADFAIWQLTVMAGAELPVTVDWAVPEKFPVTAWLSLLEVDADGNLKPDTQIDMTLSNSLVIPAGETRYYQLVFEAVRTVNIDLAVGWNLLSLPFEPLNPDVNVIFTDDSSGVSFLGPIWRWYQNIYAQALELHAFEGFWIYVTAATTTEISGRRVAPPEALLVPGWNLLGPAVGMELPGDNRLAAHCWQWLQNEQKYYMTNQMLPGNGYWLHAFEQLTLTLQNEQTDQR